MVFESDSLTSTTATCLEVPSPTATSTQELTTTFSSASR